MHEAPEDEEREICNSLCAKGDEWASSRGVTKTNALAAIIELAERLAWEPEERTPPDIIARYLSRNSRLFQVDYAAHEVSLGAGVSLGRVRGITLVWPIEQAMFERLLRQNNCDWKDIGVDSLLPADETAAAVYVESVVNLPTIVAHKKWLHRRVAQPQRNVRSGIETFRSMVAHIAELIAPLRVLSDGRLTYSDGVCLERLPRFLAEARPAKRAAGSRMTSMYGFQDVASTTRDPAHWIKRQLDFEWHRHSPLTIRAHRFARDLIDARNSIKE